VDKAQQGSSRTCCGRCSAPPHPLAVIRGRGGREGKGWEWGGAKRGEEGDGRKGREGVGRGGKGPMGGI